VTFGRTSRDGNDGLNSDFTLAKADGFLDADLVKGVDGVLDANLLNALGVFADSGLDLCNMS
jgi:hypothetical protein